MKISDGHCRAQLRDITEINSLAVREYVPQVYGGHVTLFWASQDLRSSNDLVEGWRALACGGIEVHEIPGVIWTSLKILMSRRWRES